ncbi:MAG: hypothetical protein RQ715_06460, partial [Methylococcales bacterium]|nr:hypothetical protein [Methylococcales bacterium]
ERKDALGGSRLSGFSNLQDRTGQAGRRLGQTVELMGQYKIGSNIDIFAGYSHWFKGQYFDRLAALPNRGNLPVKGEKDTDYVFTQVTFQF